MLWTLIEIKIWTLNQKIEHQVDNYNCPSSKWLSKWLSIMSFWCIDLMMCMHMKLYELDNMWHNGMDINVFAKVNVHVYIILYIHIHVYVDVNCIYVYCALHVLCARRKGWCKFQWVRRRGKIYVLEDGAEMNSDGVRKWGNVIVTHNFRYMCHSFRTRYGV